VKKKIVAKKASPKPQRRGRSGGLSKKTGHYKDAAIGEVLDYIYYQASREVPKDKLKKGIERERITGNGATPTQAKSRLEENWLKRFNEDEGDRHPRSKKIKAKDRTLRWLYEQWQEANEDGEVSDVMVKKYEGYFRLHILPHLGERKLTSLTARDFRLLFNKTLPDKKGKAGKTLLSSTAIRNVYLSLSSCYNFGVAERIAEYSPLKTVKAPPKNEVEHDMETLTANADRLLDILEASPDDDYCRWLLQFLGLRRAERLGLTWDCIENLDRDTPTLRVRQQLARYAEKGRGWYIKPWTKNQTPRTIVVPEPFIAALRKQRRRQDELRKSPDFKPKPEFANCVFLQADGEIYTLNRDNNDWARMLKSHGLPHWTGHKNRFITAVWLAAQKPVVPVQTIQSVLGHKSTALALYYQKTSIEQQMAPMKLYGEKLARGKKSG